MPSTAANGYPVVGKINSLHIAVAVIRNAEHKILLSQRREGTAGAGLWEYPGGKREPAESIEQALKRELQEELGITPVGPRPLIRIRHQYPDRHVLLDTWLVDEWLGEPQGLEGQELAWVEKEQLAKWDLLPANGPITQAACLPEHYLITPDAGVNRDEFLNGFARSLRAGRRLLRLRAPSLDDADYQSLAAQCLALCRESGARLLLDRDAEMVEQLAADGLHLTAAALMATDQRPAGMKLLAASCHDRKELAKAQALGCDFAVLGAVQGTASHPTATSLGWARAQALLDEANLPVYAIGGMTEKDLEPAYWAGAQGIAAIRGLWVSND
ncbi:MAG: Nudix family hydrolase [Nevskiales bacterium]